MACSSQQGHQVFETHSPPKLIVECRRCVRKPGGPYLRSNGIVHVQTAATVSEVQQKLFKSMPRTLRSASPGSQFSRAFFSDESLLNALNVDSRLELKAVISTHLSYIFSPKSVLAL